MYGTNQYRTLNCIVRMKSQLILVFNQYLLHKKPVHKCTFSIALVVFYNKMTLI